MATWQQLQGYIRERYDVTVIPETGAVFGKFDLGDGRTQSVLVAQAIDGSNGEEWAKIESIVGRADQVNLSALLELIRFQLVGGLAKNDDYVTVRHSIPLGSMSADEFEGPLAAVLETADYLERSVGPVDRY